MTKNQNSESRKCGEMREEGREKYIEIIERRERGRDRENEADRNRKIKECFFYSQKLVCHSKTLYIKRSLVSETRFHMISLDEKRWNWKTSEQNRNKNIILLYRLRERMKLCERARAENKIKNNYKYSVHLFSKNQNKKLNWEHSALMHRNKSIK